MVDDNLCPDCDEPCPEDYLKLGFIIDCERTDKTILFNGTKRCFLPKDQPSSTSSPQTTEGAFADNDEAFADNDETFADNDEAFADNEETFADNERTIADDEGTIND